MLEHAWTVIHSGQFLASGGDDTAVILWKLAVHRGLETMEDEDMPQVETWQVVHLMRTHEEDVYDLAWSPDSRQASLTILFSFSLLHEL